jgi:hypothetical protein
MKSDVTFFLFTLVLLSSGPAFAECNSPADVCQGVKYCVEVNLTAANVPFIDLIKKGVGQRNGELVYQGLDGCQHAVGDYDKWAEKAAGCN